jgi:hypothetical protein
LKILIVAVKKTKKEEENQHFGVWSRARQRKLVIGNLCGFLSFFFQGSIID